jgi:hypothetical protein
MMTGFCFGRYQMLLWSISDETRFFCRLISKLTIGCFWQILVVGRAGSKCYQTLSEKANHGRIGASAASVEARDWLFQIGPGVASA